MKKVNHIGSLVAVLVVSLLLTCIIYRSVFSFSSFQQIKESIVLTRQTNNTSALDSQLLYEEREGKDKAESFCDNNESKDNLFFICIISEIPPFHKEEQNYTFLIKSCAGDNSHIPRYLFNRSILV